MGQEIVKLKAESASQLKNPGIVLSQAMLTPDTLANGENGVRVFNVTKGGVFDSLLKLQNEDLILGGDGKTFAGQPGGIEFLKFISAIGSNSGKIHTLSVLRASTAIVIKYKVEN